MRLKILALLSTSALIAGCGTIATPSFQATAIIEEANETATQIVAEAQAIAQALPTEEATATTEPTATDEPSATPTDLSTSTPIPPTATTEPTEVVPPTSTPFPDDLTESELRLSFSSAENGETLFNMFQVDASFACSTCHNAGSDVTLIGPGLLNISTIAETRVEGIDAVDYIYESIVNPSAYIVDGFTDGLMPQNWADIYSEQEIFDIIAYLYEQQS